MLWRNYLPGLQNNNLNVLTIPMAYHKLMFHTWCKLLGEEENQP